MVIMDCRDLLTEVSIFLRVTLAEEKLSLRAQTCRQQLIAKITTRQSSSPPSPQGYMDMNGGLMRNPEIKHQISSFYEEFETSFDQQNQTKQQIQDGYENNLYNNLSSTHEENVYANNEHDIEGFTNLKNSTQTEDTTYTNPTSPLANTPVIPSRLSFPSKISPSNSNSERNSIISIKKDLTDKNSDSSSITSSSTKCDECPEVLAMSASALRYTAAKCGVLGRREKFLFMEHTKLYWVAALNQTLYMFNSDKDAKPVHQIDIADYRARAVAVSGITKTDFKFELVFPGKKTYQFSSEKQSDMEVWISALNAVAMDSSQRHLSSPPEVVDGRLPAPDVEYELPCTNPRPVPSTALALQLEAHFKERRLSAQSTPSARYTSRLMKENRELPQLPQELPTYDQPDPAVKPVGQLDYECLQEELYHCIPEPQIQKTVEYLRRLPLLPHELEVYDCPEPTIRPVKPQEPVQEEFYSDIENGTQNNNEESVYKNLEDSVVKTQEVVYENTEEINNKNVEDESNYYNLGVYPEAETEQESIYDVISEQRMMKNPSPIPSSEKISTSFSDKTPISFAINEELKLNLGGKVKSPVVSNIATIFNKPFNKPNLTVVKPPILNKSCQ